MSADRLPLGTVQHESEEPSIFPYSKVESPPNLTEKLNSFIKDNTRIILAHQNPDTGLFPASTVERREDEGHYGEAWVRDTSAVVKGLLYVRQFTDDTDEREVLSLAAVRSIGGLLEIAGKERWQKAFSQLIIDEGSYTHLTEEAPPIHLKLNGDVCGDWLRQNQPDSWGALLIVIGHAYEQGIFEPDDEQRKTIIEITKYLTHIKAEKFESSSMWEDREVRNPPPISTALIVEEGLKRVRKLFVGEKAPPFEKELVRIIDRKIHAIDTVVEAIYPTDFTWIEDHQSRTDLATLVALGYGDYGRLPLLQYMILANKQLGNGDLPGQIRFIGDPYKRRGNKEAVWFMALPLQSIVLLRKSLRAGIAGNMGEAVKYRSLGLARLQKAIMIGEEHGYYPELFTYERKVVEKKSASDNKHDVADAKTEEESFIEDEDTISENDHVATSEVVQDDNTVLTSDDTERGVEDLEVEEEYKDVWVPNGNDLLWNRALMIDAAVMAREALKF